MASPGGPHARTKMTQVIFLITSSLLCAPSQVLSDHAQGAVFLHEFPLIRRENHQDEFLADLMNTHKIEDPICLPVKLKENYGMRCPWTIHIICLAFISTIAEMLPYYNYGGTP